MSVVASGSDRSPGPVAGLPPAAAASFGAWRASVRADVLGELEAFLDRNRIGPVHGIAVDDIARQYLCGGKCLRSGFMYLGWLCGAEPDPAALRAAGSLELLHAFALIQDDVMDEAQTRRNQPTAHLRFGRRHREARLPGSADRFGESAATLLADICLIWADTMLRDSGIGREALHRVRPRYDAMRVELALGQFADLLNDARTEPDLETVLTVAAAKSGNYTVRRPLELGAAMAGCDDGTLAALGLYGRVVGEAFQLRDDLLGIFGAAAVTGKPSDNDLAQHKATTVVVAAGQLADPATRRELQALLSAPHIDAVAVEHLRELIVATGAREHIERMIADRVVEARRITAAALPERQRRLLDGMADICTHRDT